MKTTIIILAALLFIPSVQADQARKLELIKEVIILTQLKGALEKWRLENIAQTRATILKQAGGQASNPMMMRLIDRVMEKYAEYTKELFDYSAHEKGYVSLYDELFSERELEGLASFYKTEAGRALIRSNSEMFTRMQKTVMEKGEDTSARIDRMMKETIDEVQAELKKEGKL